MTQRVQALSEAEDNAATGRKSSKTLKKMMQPQHVSWNLFM